jgi:uncharacterized coiled-coil protein SlyX
MLVKILDADPDFVESLKGQTGTNTASKAFIHAAERFQHLRLKIDDQDRYIEAIEADLARLRAVIEGARSAAALLLDRVAQAELDV